MDVDRITHPLRLARGSHQPGSGRGCAMNMISYINGDEQITEFPAHRLFRWHRSCSCATTCWPSRTAICRRRQLLVLDLGWLTVGTADVADAIMHIWERNC